MSVKAWTDYPFAELGDAAYKEAPIRRIDVLSYDQNKYCKVLVNGKFCEVKIGYIYEKPGRLGDVPRLRNKRVTALPTKAT